MAHDLLPQVLCPAVQTFLSARRSESGQLFAESSRRLAYAERRLLRIVAGTQSPSQKIGFVLGGELQVHEHIIVDIVPDGQGAGLPFRRFL